MYYFSRLFLFLFFNSLPSRHEQISFGNCFGTINLQLRRNVQHNSSLKKVRRYIYRSNPTSAGCAVGKRATRRARGAGSSLRFCSFFLLRACAVRERSMRTSFLSWHFLSTTWVTTLKSITSGSILEFFEAFTGGHDSLPCGTESWLARTPWVLGFFSGRGKPLVLWGGTGVCPPGKREGGLPELLTVLAVILKENYLLDPCVDF